MVQRHIVGREISKEDLRELQETIYANRHPDRRRTMENPATMQTGYNSDGTIKEEKIQPHMYELNGIKDK
ncbi:hypothetical protein N4T77_11125 [Clostridium sp. CX1]|uniref:Uncharacterized protein n=1 Tax=Clostridium tanneri TaxID=3037988 RepID=A0ABU4JP36_9CLOT|nr:MULTISPECIES: hypothetical protein [unclassified Clostridium]MCT8977155.1 hypothetical protein [Clostridium sp. CX1]MDW8799899.1 hypothetical protein [Clostridium sp. A1-XYC3]